MNVLVLNAGSSSLKFQIIATDPERIREHKDEGLCRGEFDGFGEKSLFTFQRGDKPKHKSEAPVRDLASALEKLLLFLFSNQAGVPGIRSESDIHAVGHRVVHGGERFKDSALIDDAVLRGIEDCIPLAPLHNPINLQGIQAAQKLFGPQTPQVAVFDTSFHQTMPEHIYLYAIPYRYYEQQKIRRYGFHGTSHRYVASRYRALRGLTQEETNIITLHLGNGCSATAIKAGKSFDTSMGLTPLEGLVMGTRSGDLDPAVVSVIAQNENIDASGVERFLNTASGLKGISGLSNDMRELQSAAGGNERARLAIEIFCYRARKYIGAYMAAMGGADAVVFTGGIGENSAEVRERICEGLAWAGLKIDAASNQEMVGREGLISTSDSKLRGYVIPTNEELLIARDTVRAILGQEHPS
jgi:acetate kinase